MPLGMSAFWVEGALGHHPQGPWPFLLKEASGPPPHPACPLPYHKYLNIVPQRWELPLYPRDPVQQGGELP